MKKGKRTNSFNQCLLKSEIRNQAGAIKDINFALLIKQYNPQQGYSGVDELVYFW